MVTNLASPPAYAIGYGVVDQPPAGWTVSEIKENGEFDSINNKVKWTFPDNTPRTLTYLVTPPTNETGERCFQGEANVNGTEKCLIGGSNCVEIISLFPADNSPANFRLNLAEVLKYAAAFKRGDVWPTAPNPILLNYVIHGLVLYKKGECYRFEPSAGSAPVWWVPCEPIGPLALTGGGVSQVRKPVAKRAILGAPTGSAVSQMQSEYAVGVPFTVKIIVTPAPGGFAYGVEDQPPAGWSVSEITEEGEFDAVNRKVKWTFLDNLARTLSYQVTPPQNASTAMSFVGTANFDGVQEVTIIGQRTARIVVNTPPTIDPIEDQETRVNTDTDIITVVVRDKETESANLVVSATSDNQAIVRDANIQFNPSAIGERREVIIRPERDKTGTVNITITAKDESDAASTNSFVLTIEKRPANDDFVDGIRIDGASVSVTGSNVNAMKEESEPNHAGNPPVRSVWWSWTAPISGKVTITTGGSGFDTVLGVYTGTRVDQLVPVASNDDDPDGGRTSRVTINAAAGMSYQIAVDGLGGESGNIALGIKIEPLKPPISVSASGKNILLTWPTSAAGFVLEVSDDLTIWAPVAVVPGNIGDQNSVKIPVSDQRKFYRLRQE